MNSTKLMTRIKKQDRVIVLIIWILTTIVVCVTLLGYGLNLITQGNNILGIVVISLAIIIVMINGIAFRMYNQKTLEKKAIQDELSIFILYKAGYYSFVATLYIIVFMMLLTEVVSPIRYVFYIGLVLCFVVFIIIHTIVKHQDFT